MADDPCEVCADAAVAGRRPYPHDPCARHPMFALVGRRVRGLFVGPGEHTFYAVTEDGAWCWRFDGDCCSETWLADVTGVEALAARVVAVRDLELPDPNGDGRTRQDTDRAYGVELATHRGRVTLAYRNSSNGYYGGSLCQPERVDALPEGLREITDDWSAGGGPSALDEDEDEEDRDG